MKTGKKEYGFSDKWSPETEANGYTQVPNILLTCQGSLRLSHGELVTLLQLLSFQFEHKSMVYPSIARLAKRSGKGYSTTQRNLKSLEDKGFIKRKHVFGSTNRYDLTPCAIRLHEHQSICTLCITSAQKRGVNILKVNRLPYSKTTKKEYHSKKLNNNTNRKNSGISALSELVAKHQYGGRR